MPNERTAPALQSFVPEQFFSSGNPLTERLETFVSLGTAECDAVSTLCKSRRRLQAGETLVREGGTADCIYLILSGVAYRYRYLSNGRRQIFGYLLAGDLCDTQFVIQDTCDHSVGLLCDSDVAVISIPGMMSTMVQFPRIERALLMRSLVDAAILREWLLNLGQRDACQRLAHFFCELSARCHPRRDKGEERSIAFPMTQLELADTMGLTVVHVNRILQRFRREDMVQWSRRYVEILDYARLQQLAGFDASYLGLEPGQTEPRMNAYG